MGLVDNVKTKLANFTKDVSKLTVTTVTGTIEISDVTVGTGTSAKVDFGKIQDIIKANNSNTKITVIATTEIDLDGDVTQFVNTPPTDQLLFASRKELLALHNESLQHSAEARKAAFEAIFTIIKSAV
jgi:hypothetical protein